MRLDTRSLAFMTAGAVMISFSAVFVKLAHVPPTISAFYRMLIGGSVLIALAMIRREKLWAGGHALSRVLLCSFFIAIDMSLWHRSILFIGPGLATLLANFQVFFIAVIAFIFYKERPGARFLTAVPVAIFGLFLIVGLDWQQSSSNYRLGVGLALLAAFFYTFYLLNLRRSRLIERQLSTMANIGWISLGAALLMGVEAWSVEQVSFVIPDLQSWAALLGLGLVGQVLGWVLISKGMGGLDASVGGLILLLQPALAFIWDLLFFQRPTTWIEGVGVVITLGAIYLGSTRKKKKEKKTATAEA